MYDMKRLAELVRQLEDQLVICMRCGMCQSVCPLFAETGRESDVARGKLALLDGLLQEMFEDPAGVNERLDRCLLCGSCEANCPSGVKVLDIFFKARALLTGYMGLHPLKKVAFRGMLAHPALFDRIMDWGSKVQSLFFKPADDLLGTSCGRILTPLGKRHFKPLARAPFHHMVQSLVVPVVGSRPAVGFFVGCLVDKVFPNVAQAVVSSLGHHEVGVFIPKDQGCCGIPALSSGDVQTFLDLVRHNLDRFSSQPFDYLVTACATCSATIRKVWPMMAGGLKAEEQARVLAFSERVLDISQYLVDVVGLAREGPDQIGQGVKLTYHDPCHLKKSLGVAVQPRALISRNPRYDLREMADADRCCGCGGSFTLQHSDISASIGQRKRDRIVETECSVIATGCPACMLQISDVLSRNGDAVLVKHFVEIYAESLE